MGNSEIKQSSYKRKHRRRVHEHDGAYILCRQLLGQILNISEGGMAVRLVGELASFNNKLYSTPSCRSIVNEIDRVPIKLAHSTDINRDIQVGYFTQTIGFEFDNVDETRQAQINKHVNELP